MCAFIVQYMLEIESLDFGVILLITFYVCYLLNDKIDLFWEYVFALFLQYS